MKLGCIAILIIEAETYSKVITKEALSYKNISLLLLSKRVHSLLLLERLMERHILRERSSLHIFLWEPEGVNTFTPSQARQRRPNSLIGCVPGLTDLCLCLKLTAWFSSRGLLPVTHLLHPSALKCFHIPVYSSQRDSLSKHTGSLGTNRKSMSYVI